MAQLSLSLLGTFQASLDGEPVTGFKSNKERALLAYLAVEAGRPHRREVLAGLLWPEWADRDALSNLRYALSNLRRAVGDQTAEPPYLFITRDSLQFNSASDHELDVAGFRELVAGEKGRPPAAEQLEQAVALYRGGFLEGFSVSESAGFEEWALLTRERLARQLGSVLHELAAINEARGDYEQAQRWAWRQLEQEPWDESARQQLMRALALSGQRSAALAEYESCRRVLGEELGVEPGEETSRLYEQIRDGKLKAPLTPANATVRPIAGPPRFLEMAAPHMEQPVFVARERELAQLEGFLERAVGGRGRVALVTGEVGSGKTALLQEFARRAQVAHGDLAVAVGNCNAYTGIGDPYLPFREMLEMLTGDVEARWAAGAMTSEHAQRLWHMLPAAAQALVDDGLDLIDTFVPRAALLERARTYAPGGANWLSRLEEAVQRMPVTGFGGAGRPGSQQSDLFEQYTRVLQAIARQSPLLLVLDDLQWADLGSISLLFHLGRRLGGSSMLIVGAYRAEEVAFGRDGARHPLEPAVNEFQRDYGHITVNLDQAESRDFLEAVVDSEPNRLDAAFREMLYRQTGGHPLFTIELLRGLQEQGDLACDEEGRWVEGPGLDWERLPARVEAVIAERLARLSEPLQEALRVACVEGEIFTAEVVARVRASDERTIMHYMSGELDRNHRLVRAQSIVRVGGQLLSRYRFRHILFQKYLYGSLDEVERVHLHEQVGTALEGLYGDPEQVGAIAPQLAVHFQKARSAEKAIRYLHQAGDRAVQLSAYQEANAHLTRALDLLLSQTQSPERAQYELALTLSLGMASKLSIPSSEVESILTRARDLSRQVGTAAQLCRVAGELAIFPYVRAEHQRSRELGEEALAVAIETADPLLIAASHWQMGFVSFVLGEFEAARAHLQKVITFYQPQEHHQALVFFRGSDAGAGALAYDACCLWCLGYPEQAAKRSEEALTLAHEFNHAFTLADVLCFAGCLFYEMQGETRALHKFALELVRLSESMSISSFLGTATCYLGEALCMLGMGQEGMACLREGLAERQSMGTRCYYSGILGGLATGQIEAGQPEEALATLAEAVSFAEETDERYCEAELHRLKGKLLLAQGDEAAGEASLHKAMEVARRQQAKSWELRAAISLGQLWQSQGKRVEAHRMLAEVYDWFTEGFDTPDLVKARRLLEELRAKG